MGDIMMHSPQFRFDAGTFFEQVAQEMKNADIAIANMEFTLSGEPYSGFPSFSAPDQCAEKFCRALGLDIMLTANNHILDRGSKGLLRTLDIYDSIRKKIGTIYTGSARDPKQKQENYPLVISRKGLRIAFINFTYATNCADSDPWPRTFLTNANELQAAISTAKKKGADYIIALPHWGNEYELYHSQKQREIAEWLITNGVDAIIGTHPHVIQDVEYIQGKPVFYSLGNAVSNMRKENCQLGMMVTLRIKKELFTGKCTFLKPKVSYTWCSLPGEIQQGHYVVFAKQWAQKAKMWRKHAAYIKMMETLQRYTGYTDSCD